MEEGPLARVIPFPKAPAPPEKSCFDCIHHRDISDNDTGLSSWCALWEQGIDSETYEAEDCSTYQTRSHE